MQFHTNRPRSFAPVERKTQPSCPILFSYTTAAHLCQTHLARVDTKMNAWGADNVSTCIPILYSIAETSLLHWTELEPVLLEHSYRNITELNAVLSSSLYHFMSKIPFVTFLDSECNICTKLQHQQYFIIRAHAH